MAVAEEDVLVGVRVGVRLVAALDGEVVVGTTDVAEPLGAPLLLVGSADVADAEGVGAGGLVGAGPVVLLAEQAARPSSSSAAAARAPERG